MKEKTKNPTKRTTLCLVYDHPKILLGFKKRDFGRGRWNGYGGKLEAGETLEENVIREMREECGLTPTKFRQLGRLIFEFLHDGEIIEVNVFEVTAYEGEPVETEEMKPKWFDVKKIPWKQMWPDDEHWYDLFLAGKKFEGHFLFKDHDRIIRHEVREIVE